MANIRSEWFMFVGLPQNAREQKMEQLREELEEAKRVRERGEEKFQTFILEEVAALKNGLILESQVIRRSESCVVRVRNFHQLETPSDSFPVTCRSLYVCRQGREQTTTLSRLLTTTQRHFKMPCALLQHREGKIAHNNHAEDRDGISI